MSNLAWKDAIVKVLEDSGEQMHYVDITQKIIELRLRDDFGATPQNSVNREIRKSINNEGNNSPFFRVDSGEYILRKLLTSEFTSKKKTNNSSKVDDDESIIKAYGMYWDRYAIDWKDPHLLGKPELNDKVKASNFDLQRGIYVLHDGRIVVYIGRTTTDRLITRLKEHIADRHAGRWNRFSWFGLLDVSEKGEIIDEENSTVINAIIKAAEALLIEVIEPPGNRKQGDFLKGKEYLQVIDPEIEKKQQEKLLKKMLDSLGNNH